VGSKNYYALLEIQPTAPVDEVKRAFRTQIALYHPDKVQHLGKEFQAMAADRAAALTEAYRVLSDAGRRAEYDRAVATAGPEPASPVAAPAAPPPDPPPTAPPPPFSERADAAASGPQFGHERRSRDEFVRKATMSRFRSALEAVAGDYEQAEVAGFDVACLPKSKLFMRGKGPRLLVRFVPRVDAHAVAEAWTRAGQSNARGSDATCVFLMGSSVAPSKELAVAIHEQRRRSRGTKVTLIPVDARDWDAHMPTDAPDIAKTLLARLRSGT
jgi:curved DNA-binding protein CbpA